MSKPTDIGPNRTGIKTSPVESKRMVDGAEQYVPNPSFDTTAHDKMAVEYSRSAPPRGTLPPPAGPKGAAMTALEMLKGNKPTVFLDMLAERLAFERTGTRLYEALLCRYDAADIHEGDPTRDELERIRDEEMKHFHMLVGAIEFLGADPTAMTPGANVSALAGEGLVKTIADPRCTLTEGLKAILIAELADNDGWAVLAEMATQLGHKKMADDFRQALAEEDEHLRLVRGWVHNALSGQAGIERKQVVSPAPQPQP
jgi:rubrerythrin